VTSEARQLFIINCPSRTGKASEFKGKVNVCRERVGATAFGQILTGERAGRKEEREGIDIHLTCGGSLPTFQPCLFVLDLIYFCLVV